VVRIGTNTAKAAIRVLSKTTLKATNNLMKIKNFSAFPSFPLGVLILSASLLGACVHHVRVSGSFPAPVGDRLPLVVGLYFSPEFKNYAPVEVLYQRSNWKIDLGTASEQMFEQVFYNLSNRIVVLKDKPDGNEPPEGVDLIVIPTFTDFGLLDPSATPLEFFSLSFKYKIDVFAPDGNLVADWTINAYGKAPSYALNAKNSVKEALMFALRDAAASLTLDFPRQPGVIRYINKAGANSVAQTQQEENSD